MNKQPTPWWESPLLAMTQLTDEQAEAARAALEEGLATLRLQDWVATTMMLDREGKPA